MHRQISEQRLSKQLPKIVRDLPDKEFLIGVLLVAFISGAWQLLDQPSRDKVVELVRNGPSADVVKVLGPLARIGALKHEVEARVSKLSVQELAGAIGLYGLKDLGKLRALELLSQARSFSSVNEVVDKVVLPQFESLNRADLVAILEFPSKTGADLLHSGGLAKIVERVRGTTLFQPDEFDALLKEHGAAYLASPRIDHEKT